MKVACFSTKWLFAAVVVAITLPLSAKHSPPPKPAVAPHISRHYPGDKNNDGIDDDLKQKADNARTENERKQMVPVEVIFTEQVTQQQLDAFEDGGGEIDHVYQTISYGWNGRCPLGLVHRIPKLLGASMVLIEEAKEIHLNLINATQTGRVRPVWANSFSGGYSGSTNITIGIIDTGVDDTHTDLTGRRVFWKDYGNSANTTPLDYHGHGTHVAGIALGTGAAGGTSASPFNFSLWNTLSGASSGQFYSPTIILPSSSLTWYVGGIWSGGGQTTLYELYRGAGNSGGFTVQASSFGGSPLTLSSSFTPSSSSVYCPTVVQSSTANGVTDYVVTNSIVNYPGVGDGFAKFRGVAPLCKIAAARVATGTGSGLNSSYCNSALDDMTTGRITNKIKVINCSFGSSGSPGINVVQRQYVNNAVGNGIVVVVAAGNDGTGATASAREIDDPGRAALAITVAAENAIHQVTDYSSQGFTSPGSTVGIEEDYKPDLMAPGGSKYYGGIFSADSNTQDGNLADATPNDYTPDVGTSMAAPFVSGCAALVINALEQNGRAWDFNSKQDPIYVKMLLSATATECNGNRESSVNNPTLQRAGTDGTGFPAGKDQYEGYGVINPDAAIEAATLSFTENTTLTNVFSGGTSDRRAWARKFTLNGGETVTLNLTNPATGDFDLYLYSATPGTFGQPILLASSTTAVSGGTETVSYTASSNFVAFVVVKRVSGSGTFTVRMTPNSNDNFANAWTLTGASGAGSGNNVGYSTEAGEPTFGSTGERKTAWYSWTAPVSGTARFTVNNGHIFQMYEGSTVSTLHESGATILVAGDINTLSYYVAAGNVYRIAVDSMTFQSGAFSITYVYDSIQTASFTNSQTIITPDGHVATPYPSTVTVPTLSGILTKATVTLNNFSNLVAGNIDIILVNPSGTATYLMSDCGVVGPMSEAVTLTFDDSAASSLSTAIPTTGTYKPTNLGGGDSFPSPAPSGTYYTNLSVFNSQSVGGTWSLYVYNDGEQSSGAGGATLGWTLSLTMDQAPIFYDFSSSTMTFTENGAATQLVTGGFISDPDSPDFNGGSVTVKFTSNGAAEDRLVVLDQGTGANQVGAQGGVLSYSGVNIGNYTGGTSGASPLIVNFTNTQATIGAVEKVMMRLAYTNVSDTPSTLTRGLMITINDGDGGTNAVTRSINVTAVNDAPILTSISTLTNGVEDTPYTITYANLRAAASASDPEGSALSFRVESYTGTLTKNSTNVVVGSTLLSTNETWTWTPPTNVNGATVMAVTVTAWDGSAASTNSVAVNVNVASVNDVPVVANAVTNQIGTYGSAFNLTFPTNTFNDVDGGSLTYTATGLPSGITLNGGTRTFSGTPTQSGSYNINLIATDSASAAATNAFSLSISKASLTATANSATRSYGQTNPAFSGSLSGIVNNDNITLNPTCSATTNSAPGTYAINAALNDPSNRLTNYNTTLTGNTLTVTKASLSVTASAFSRQYGLTNPALTATYSGFVNNQTLATSDVAGSPSLTTSATTNSAVGTYAIDISAGSLTSTNYSFTLNSNTLSVTTAPLTITVSNVSRIYGGTTPTLTGSLSGIRNNDNISATYNVAATSSSPAGTYPISVTLADPGARLGNYTVTTNTATLTITKGTLLVAADAKARIYGETNPILTATFSGFANGEVLATSDVTGSPSLTTSAVTNSAVGTYSVNIALGSLVSTNYSLTLTNNLLSVSAAPLTITLSNVSRSYGASNPTLTGSLTGIRNNDNISATFNVAATTNSPAGTYPISITLSDPNVRLGNYTVTTNAGTLTITKAGLLIAADSQSRIYGDMNPPLTVSYSGFVNGEVLASSGITGTPAVSCVAVTNSDIGTYPIVVSVGTLASSNYAFDFVETNLTVTKASLVVTVDNASRAVDTSNPTFTGSISGVKNNDNITATFTTTASLNSAVGTYPITATLVDPNGRLGNYFVNSSTGTLTITNANKPPIIVLNPITDTIKAGGVTMITAGPLDLDGTIAKVDLFEGATLLGTIVTPPYVFNWTNTFAGTFTLVAVATDNGNATGRWTNVVTVVPNISAPQFSPTFQMLFHGASNSPYTAEYSTNLAAWFTLTNFTEFDAPVVITDITSATNRFYRVRSN